MSTSKHLDKICCIILAVVLILTVLFINAGKLGVQAVSATVGYASKLFNTSTVHTIDIVMDDWDSFIENCTDEQYADCTVIIDGEAYRNVAIRAKGNTSLTSVESYGNGRYSFKIEFDHYDDGISYYGLDKLCLNNIIQDNTYMKDYLTYQLMREFGADTPLCSYSYITVNGSDWGLYLAVEGIEDSFLQRCYGNGHGQLYKPDSMNMGGGMPHDRAMGSSDVSLIYTDDEFDSYSNIFDNAKTDLTDNDKTRLIESLKKLNNNEDIENIVDIDEVIRYFVVHNFVLNFDSYTGSMIHNYYLYEENGQLSMIPWDYNLAFGGFESQTDATKLVNYPIDTPVSGGTTDSRPMLAWIFNNEKYTDLYYQYFAEFIARYFDNGYFGDMADSTKELIAPYVESDPTKFCTYEEFEKGLSALKNFCTLRAESISGQLDGTIPATSEGQAQDSSALLDAGGLEIADMGTMELMMGGGFPGGNGHAGEFPDRDSHSDSFPPRGRQEDATEVFNPQGNFAPPDDFAPSDKPAASNDTVRPDNFAPPDIQNGSPAYNTVSLVLFGVSTGILILGLITALLFRRRR